MPVRGGSGAIEVQFLVAREAAVRVVRLNLILGQLVPSVGHDLLHGSKGERAMLSHRFFPVMKEGIVERREALGGLTATSSRKSARSLLMRCSLRRIVAMSSQREGDTVTVGKKDQPLSQLAGSTSRHAHSL